MSNLSSACQGLSNKPSHVSESVRMILCTLEDLISTWEITLKLSDACNSLFESFWHTYDMVELQFVVHLLLETHDLLAWFDKWHTHSINFSVLCFTIWHDAMRLPLLKAMKPWDCLYWRLWNKLPHDMSELTLQIQTLLFFKKKTQSPQKKISKMGQKKFFPKEDKCVTILYVLVKIFTWWEKLSNLFDICTYKKIPGKIIGNLVIITLAWAKNYLPFKLNTTLVSKVIP